MHIILLLITNLWCAFHEKLSDNIVLNMIVYGTEDI